MIYGTPTIVTNGLVLNLDAASPKAAPTRNLLYTTNDLTNTGAWLTYNSTLTASAATAPDGTNTAYAWNIATSGTSSLVRISGYSTNAPISSSVYGGQYTFSVYVKNRNCTAKDFNLSIYNGPYNIGFEPIFSITSSFAPQTAPFGNATFSNPILRSEDAGNGWYRISYTTTVTGSLNTFNVFFDIEVGGGTKVAGEGIYIWGPQFEPGPTPTPYQPVFGTSSRNWPSIGSTITGSMVNRATVNQNYIRHASANLHYTTVPNLGDLPLWTVETFVRFNDVYNTKVAMVVGNQYNLSNKLNFTIGTNNSPSNYNIAVGFFDGSWHSTTGVTYPINTWFHIVGTYDGSTIKQYTNGVLVDSLSYVGTPSSGGEVRINRRWDDVVIGSNLLDTDISVVRIYNRALSQAEILQNYNALKSRFGLS